MQNTAQNSNQQGAQEKTILRNHRAEYLLSLFKLVNEYRAS